MKKEIDNIKNTKTPATPVQAPTVDNNAITKVVKTYVDPQIQQIMKKINDIVKK